MTGTPLAGLHRPERWNDQAAALISGESVALAAKRCDVHPSTAFRWRHRFLAALNLDKPPSLSGPVEADETFILESFKGKGKTFRENLASGVARPANGGCRLSRSQSPSHGTARARRRTPCWRVSTPSA
jgi:transposase-like protein